VTELRKLKTVAELLPHFLTSREERNLRPMTLVNYGVWAGVMAREWGARAVRQVRPSQITGLLQSHSRNYAQCAQAFFRWLVKLRVLPLTFDPGTLPLAPRSDEKQPCYLTPAETRAFLAAVRPQYRGVFVLGFFAGLRPYECCRIEWPSINLTERRIKVEARVSKIRRARIVEGVPAVLWSLLRQCPDRTGRVLPAHGDTAEHVAVARWIHERRRAAAVAGVTLGHDVIRHTFATYYVALTGTRRWPARSWGTTSCTRWRPIMTGWRRRRRRGSISAPGKCRRPRHGGKELDDACEAETVPAYE